MKLSMPLVINGKTLLDSGVAIDSERMLNLVKENGVERIDVKGEYLESLSNKYPEFYNSKKEKVLEAKSSGRMKRAESADFLVKIRTSKEKVPTISICAHRDALVDIKTKLAIYFKIELISDTLGDVVQSMARSSLLIIFCDDFKDDPLREAKKNMAKLHPKIKTLGVYQNSQSIFTNSLKWLDNGAHLLKAAFISCYPEKLKEFEIEIPGSCIPALNRSLLDIVYHGDVDGVEQFVDGLEGFDVRLSTLDEYRHEMRSKLVLFRIDNRDNLLLENIKKNVNISKNLNKVLIIVSQISKEEALAVKAMGNVRILLGDLQNEKLFAFLLKLKPTS